MQPQQNNSSQLKMKDDDAMASRNSSSLQSAKSEQDRNTDKPRMADEASGVLASIKQGASQVASKAEEMASDAFDKTKEYGEKLVSETGATIKRYPTQALVIAGAVGVLVGFLVARR
jgi:ElaB/YqjD/DUF883 family membrane-anchored ribosome-binding protein